MILWSLFEFAVCAMSAVDLTSSLLKIEQAAKHLQITPSSITCTFGFWKSDVRDTGDGKGFP